MTHERISGSRGMAEATEAGPRWTDADVRSCLPSGRHPNRARIASGGWSRRTILWMVLAAPLLVPAVSGATGPGMSGPSVREIERGLPDSLDRGRRAAVLVVYGSVFDGDQMTLWRNPDTLSFEVRTRGGSTTAIISETEPGEYAGALVDWSGAAVALAGDTLEFSISPMVGVVLDSLHVLQAEEIEAGMAAVDLILASAISEVEDAEEANGASLRIFPNPARGGGVRMLVRLPASGPGEVSGILEATVVDPSGRPVARLRRAWNRLGEGALRWDGRTDDGRTVPPGVYFVRLRAGGHEVVGRFVIAK